MTTLIGPVYYTPPGETPELRECVEGSQIARLSASGTGCTIHTVSGESLAAVDSLSDIADAWTYQIAVALDKGCCVA